MLKKMWVPALVLLVAGCASLSQQINRSGPLTDEEIANARADDVPVIIYDTSFSHGATPQEVTGLTVQLINVSDKQIDMITLLVVSCLGATGQEQDVYATLPMKGPFASKGIYASHPTIDDSTGWTSRRTSQMIIKAADVVFQDGSKQSFTGKDVSKLLGHQLSNYCSTILYPNRMP